MGRIYNVKKVSTLIEMLTCDGIDGGFQPIFGALDPILRHGPLQF